MLLQASAWLSNQDDCLLQGGSMDIALKIIGIFALCALCLVSHSAVTAAGETGANVYQWTDSHGTVHYTDNPLSIPARSSNRIIKRESIKGVATPQQDRKEETARTIPKNNKTDLYGGHDESWWRDRYASLRSQIRQIKESAPGKQTLLRELHYNKAASAYIHYKGTYSENRTAYRQLYQEIKNDEARLVELEKDLESIEVEASRNGVPFDWRK
jgi:hypothetical protein